MPETELVENPPENRRGQDNKLNVNTYATKKTIAQGLLDIALLSANASQLKFILQTGKAEHPFYTLTLTFILISIVLQVLTGITIMYVGMLNINKEEQRARANWINNAIVIQIFLISAINVFISTFGFDHHVLPPSTIPHPQLAEIEKG